MSTHFLTVEALTKVYPSDSGKANPPVFEDIHFHIDKGEFVCIIGHSGCGKRWSGSATPSTRSRPSCRVA